MSPLGKLLLYQLFYHRGIIWYVVVYFCRILIYGSLLDTTSHSSSMDVITPELDSFRAAAVGIGV